MSEKMKAADRMQAPARMAHTAQSGKRSQNQAVTPTRELPTAVAANQPPCIEPLYLGGATRETNEMPIGLRKSAAIVSIPMPILRGADGSLPLRFSQPKRPTTIGVRTTMKNGLKCWNIWGWNGLHRAAR